MTQRLEKDFRNRLVLNPNIWFIKLQVFPGAYTSMPADFLILGLKGRYLVECKENRSKRYPFSRSNQIRKMSQFRANNPLNEAYFLINFWLGRIKSSPYYLIPITEYLKFEAKMGLLGGRKSGNIEQFKAYLGDWLVDFENIANKFI